MSARETLVLIEDSPGAGQGVIRAPGTGDTYSMPRALNITPESGPALTLTSGGLTLTGNISVAAWTTNGIHIKGGAATLTDTSSSGTVAAAYTNVIGGNTIAASSATTFTDYAALYLPVPVAGTNVTLTNAYSLIAAGQAKFGGNVTLTSGSVFFASGGPWLQSNSAAVNMRNGNTTFYSDANDTIDLRRTTNAQTINWYGTYASSTDYHRGGLKAVKGTASAVSGATATLSNLIPAGAVVVGVTTKVTTGLGTSNGTTGYQVGDGSDADRWGAITGTVAGTSSDNTNATATGVNLFTAANNVVLTAVGGNFNGTGVIDVCVIYLIAQCD